MEITIVIDQKDVDAFNAKYFMDHPRAKKVRIKSPQHPSLNWYMTANNMEANNVKQVWKDFMVFVLTNRNLINQKIDRCEVVYRTFFKRKCIHDLDNITPKYIFDGLVEGGFLVGDDCTHITRLTTECFYDKENPRIELKFIY